jgi:hypothetical protein
MMLRCGMRHLLLPLLCAACFSFGCPEQRAGTDQTQAQTAAVAVTADETMDDEPGVDDPTMGEAPAAPLDVDGMSDDELQTACFEGRQAACDRLGH